MQQYGEIPKEVEITNVKLFCSRIYGGCKEDSDLDVKIEYRNTSERYVKEDHMFCILSGLTYKQFDLDFFPVLID